jgi:hypothetical protein
MLSSVPVGCIHSMDICQLSLSECLAIIGGLSFRLPRSTSVPYRICNFIVHDHKRWFFVHWFSVPEVLPFSPRRRSRVASVLSFSTTAGKQRNGKSCARTNKIVFSTIPPYHFQQNELKCMQSKFCCDTIVQNPKHYISIRL